MDVRTGIKQTQPQNNKKTNKYINFIEKNSQNNKKRKKKTIKKFFRNKQITTLQQTKNKKLI